MSSSELPSATKRPRSFGIPAAGNPKSTLKPISKIFAHTDKTVRDEGAALCVALYPYLGPALLPTLSDLKPLQMSELQKQFDRLDGEGKSLGSSRPARQTRKAQREGGGEEFSPNDDKTDGGKPALALPSTFDPKSLLDPVNVYKLFPADLEERLGSTKWKDRLEALEECQKALSAPQNARIADDNVDSYGSLASTLAAKCRGDANINVVIEAAKVLEGMANGLGKPLGRYRASILPGLLDRLKERKASVVEALAKALDAVFSTVSVRY